MKTSHSKSSLHIVTLASLLVSLIGGVVFVTPAHAAGPFTVNSATDAVDAAPGDGVCETAPGNGVCTLRAAIQEANALAGDDTITVPAGTYMLTIPGRDEYAAATGDLNITSNITINGAGAGSTIIQAGTLGVGGPPNGIDRVFAVYGAFTVNISGVTVRNGNVSSGKHGGGIANYLGTLTITNSTFSGNSTTSGYGGSISNNGTLTVTNSTFSGNSAPLAGGGGIMNSGILTITNTTFSGNSAPSSGNGGGIYNNSGTATITNSTFSSNSTTSNGGGIYINAGEVTILNSTFSGNNAYEGGGIYIYTGGAMTLTNSTFSGNSASGDGGGITNGGTLNITNSTFSGNNANGGSGVHGGGGITNGGTLNITNSTFSGNGASGGIGGGICNWSTGTLTISNSAFSGNNTGGSGGGGGIYNQGTVTITNSTLSGNSTGPAGYGGGIYNFGGTGTVTLLNTIVANSTGPNCLSSVTITADSYNLDTDGTCDNATQKTTAQIKLGSLANNGGPTQTFALLTGSSAIDAGNDTVCAAAVGSPTYGAGGLDQRGVSRPQGAYCDIGSYETIRQSGPNFLVNTNIDINDNACENAPGNCSLREAIIAANATAGDDTITVPVGIYTLTIAGTGEEAAATGDLDLTSNITINGAGASTAIIDGGALDRVFHVTGTFTVNISGVTVRNGNASGADDGGGIFNPVGTVTITNCTFSGNSATGGYGGGIFNNAGDLIITNSTVSGNSAPNGGGIFNLTGNLTLVNSTLSGNSAPSDRGGGIFNNAGDLTITNSTVSGNSATNGAIYNGIGSVSLRNTIVANSTGGNCSGTIINGGNNIDSAASCGWVSASGSMSNTPPLLGALANNGGPTQTFALLTGSSAIDAGNDTVCNADPVNRLDQRGIARPQGAHCDIGSYEAPDTTPPTVLSITRVDTNPINAASVHFTVTFSEAVTGVDAADFNMTTTGAISFPSITGVTGSGTTYTVTVNTGSGNGTIRLNVPTSATIADLAGNLLTSLPYTGGETYTIIKVFTIFLPLILR